MAKLPSFQFYPGDWLKDAELRVCSIFARGLLVDLLCVCFESKHRGRFVRPDGVTPWTREQIVDSVCGSDREEKIKALQELEEHGVLKRCDKGILYSSRIVRDEDIRQIRASHGSKGGSKTQANDRAKPKQTVEQKSTPSSSSSSSSSEEEISARAELDEKPFDPNHEPIPVIPGKSIPWGLRKEELDRGDMLRVEAAFLARWEATEGAAKVSAARMAKESLGRFRERVYEPGWIYDAEDAMTRMPLPFWTGKLMALDKLLEPQAALLIATGSKYDRVIDDNAAKKFNIRKSAGDARPTGQQSFHHESSRPQREAEAARAARMAAYYADVVARWGHVIDEATSNSMTTLDQKYPRYGLAMFHAKATVLNAKKMYKESYRKAFAECLEMDSGGKSFEQLEAAL